MDGGGRVVCVVDPSDGVERGAQLAQQQYVLEVEQLGLLVEPAPVRAGAGGSEQRDGVVVPQGPAGDSGLPRHGGDVEGLRLSHASTLQVDAASTARGARDGLVPLRGCRWLAVLIARRR